ncbi:hypothetical protein [Streptomyces sp. WM6378]|uniref:hypothetical protein n=1 Tax=Streptomyces sp. WM6378 TaxID=1415557 RepID=UPI0006AF9076|nr:hypothetical protein [Streptomyces sp. WM6378]KOU39031.1 hypothetical protein ADK54_27165 [Streptomyces sp. WM6378]
MFGRRELSVLALRDADDIARALREALEGAGEAERPGLEAALQIAEQAAAVPDRELRGRWVREQRASVGYTGPDDESVRAVKALRDARPELSLLSAVQLTKDAVR